MSVDIIKSGQVIIGNIAFCKHVQNSTVIFIVVIPTFYHSPGVQTFFTTISNDD